MDTFVHSLCPACHCEKLVASVPPSQVALLQASLPELQRHARLSGWRNAANNGPLICSDCVQREATIITPPSPAA